MRASLDAGFHQVGAVKGIRTHRRKHDASALSERIQRDSVEAVRDDRFQVALVHAERFPQFVELFLTATSDGPAQVSADAILAQQVFRNERACESGRAPHDDVEFS